MWQRSSRWPTRLWNVLTRIWCQKVHLDFYTESFSSCRTTFLIIFKIKRRNVGRNWKKKFTQLTSGFGLVRFVPGLNLVRIPVGPERKVTRIKRDKRKKKKNIFQPKKKGGNLKCWVHIIRKTTLHFLVCFLMKSSRDGTKKHHFLVFSSLRGNPTRQGRFYQKKKIPSVRLVPRFFLPPPPTFEIVVWGSFAKTLPHTVVFLYYSISLYPWMVCCYFALPFRWRFMVFDGSR